MNKYTELFNKCEQKHKKLYEEIDKIALFNQEKVLNAFRHHRISAQHFMPTTGYGYSDLGRDTMCEMISTIFSTDKTIFSPLISSGTHALYIALSGCLKSNSNFISIGKPYDTLNDIIFSNIPGSLKENNINCSIIDLNSNNQINDLKLLKETIVNNDIKLALITRSSGYLWREALSIDDISLIIKNIKQINKDIIIMVDNCYGEFTSALEPSEIGADICVGSFIKNIGGGLAPTGAYITGKSQIIEQISYRFIAPSIGIEIGSYNNSYQSFYQGLFSAPITVKNALKGSILFGFAFESLNYKTNPNVNKVPKDIIRAIKLDSKEKLIKFVQKIQHFSPIDSYVKPIPWDMPGYNHEVIMAAGTFVQGSSIELSADAPIKEPFVVYLQGGLSYEHCKIALQGILDDFT